MEGTSAISPAGFRAVIWTLLSVDYVVFIIRGIFLFKRRKETRNSLTKWSDISLLAAIILLTVACIGCDWTAAKWEYYDKHPSPYVIPNFGVPLNTAIVQQKIALAVVVVYYCQVWCVKLAFISIYFEFRQRLSPRLQATLYAITGITALTWVLNVILNLAWCRPIQTTWTFDQSFCSPGTTPFLIIFGGATNIFSDLLLMVFPILFLHTINLPNSQRWGIWILVFFGTVTITFAALRMGFLASVTGDKETDPANFLKVWLDTLLFGAIEQGVGFLAACLPALRTMLAAKIKGQSTGGSASKDRMELSFRRNLNSKKRASETYNTLETVNSVTNLREEV